MKDGIKEIVGKRISAVVVARKKTGPPPAQVFLVFDDNTHFEIYGSFTGAGGLDKGGVNKAIDYATTTMKAEIESVFRAPSPKPSEASKPPKSSAPAPSTSNSMVSSWDNHTLQQFRATLINERQRIVGGGSFSGLKLTATILGLFLAGGAVLEIVRHGVDWYSGICVALGTVAGFFAWRHDSRWKGNSELLAEVNDELARRRKVG